MTDLSQIYDIGLLIPDTTDFDTLNPGVQEEIQLMSAVWPSFPMIGTRAVNGYAMCYIRLRIKPTKSQLEALFDTYNLNWNVVGIRSAFKIKEVVTGQDVEGNDIIKMDYDTVLALPRDPSILEYLNDIQDYDPVTKEPIYDVDENAVMRRPTLDDDIYLSVYSFTDPIKL